MSQLSQSLRNEQKQQFQTIETSMSQLSQSLHDEQKQQFQTLTNNVALQHLATDIAFNRLKRATIATALQCSTYFVMSTTAKFMLDWYILQNGAATRLSNCKKVIKRTTGILSVASIGLGLYKFAYLPRTVDSEQLAQWRYRNAMPVLFGATLASVFCYFYLEHSPDFCNIAQHNQAYDVNPPLDVRTEVQNSLTAAKKVDLWYSALGFVSIALWPMVSYFTSAEI